VPRRFIAAQFWVLIGGDNGENRLDSGLDDEQLDLAGPAERGRFGAVRQSQRTVKPSQGTFRIGHHRQVRLPAREPPCRAKFGEGLGPLADPVRGDADGLTDHADPGREVPCHPRVRVGAFRVLLELGGDEATAHAVGQIRRQGPQFGAGLRVQLVSGRMARDRWSPATVGSAALRAPGS